MKIKDAKRTLAKERRDHSAKSKQRECHSLSAPVWDCVCKWTTSVTASEKRRKKRQWMWKQWNILLSINMPFTCTHVTVLYNERISEINYQTLLPEDKCWRVESTVERALVRCEGEGAECVSTVSLIIPLSIASEWITTCKMHKMPVMAWSDDSLFLIFCVFVSSPLESIAVERTTSLLTSMCDANVRWRVFAMKWC